MNETFIEISIVMEQRSKYPSLRVKTWIVNGKNRIVTTRYNDFSDELCDNIFPWERKGYILNLKYTYVCH